MKTIFVDLEMHPIARVFTKEFATLKTETIEIGAVMLDEHLREIASFKEYVHPDYSNKVYAKYQKLTGITTEMLADAECFRSVFDHFCKWCGDDYTIYSWSDNDIWQLMKECELIGGLDFSGHAHDGLIDARNTADLYRQISDTGRESFHRLLRNLKEASRPCTCSIMEVVDFKQFDLAQ